MGGRSQRLTVNPAPLLMQLVGAYPDIVVNVFNTETEFEERKNSVFRAFGGLPQL
jgi:hypothetical protein